MHYVSARGVDERAIKIRYYYDVNQVLMGQCTSPYRDPPGNKSIKKATK